MSSPEHDIRNLEIEVHNLKAREKLSDAKINNLESSILNLREQVAELVEIIERHTPPTESETENKLKNYVPSFSISPITEKT